MCHLAPQVLLLKFRIRLNELSGELWLFVHPSYWFRKLISPACSHQKNRITFKVESQTARLPSSIHSFQMPIYLVLLLQTCICFYPQFDMSETDSSRRTCTRQGHDIGRTLWLNSVEENESKPTTPIAPRPANQILCWHLLHLKATTVYWNSSASFCSLVLVAVYSVCLSGWLLKELPPSTLIFVFKLVEKWTIVIVCETCFCKTKLNQVSRTETWTNIQKRIYYRTFARMKYICRVWLLHDRRNQRTTSWLKQRRTWGGRRNVEDSPAFAARFDVESSAIDWAADECSWRSGRRQRGNPSRYSPAPQKIYAILAWRRPWWCY